MKPVIVASCLKANNRAIFIGTETGGNPNVLAGYADYFELPNTKMNIEIPTLQFVMTSNIKNDGKGLIPDFIMNGSILDQIDTEMNFIKDHMFLDEKRKLGIVKQMKKKIASIGITNQDLGPYY